ncbi:MAG: hypothetical protein WA977_05930 [Halobacteriota archaeon]
MKRWALQNPERACQNYNPKGVSPACRIADFDFGVTSLLLEMCKRVRHFKTLKGLVETGACGGFDFDVSNTTQ